MKPILNSLFAVALGLLVNACTDDLLPGTVPGGEGDRGDLTEVTISLAVAGLEVESGATRDENPSEIPEPVTDAEKKVDNLWVFQFDASGNQLIRPRYYTISNQDELNNLPVLLKAGVPSTICIVTNTGKPEWALGAGFGTYESLKSKTIPNPEPQYAGSDLSIPMWGAKENVTVDLSVKEVITVVRMFAKLKVLVNLDDVTGHTLSLKSIDIGNISQLCQVSTRYDSEQPGQAADYAGAVATDWISRSWAAGSLTTTQEGGYDYATIYVPENIQGEVAGLDSEVKKNDVDNAPAKALKVSFSVVYTDPDDPETQYQPYTYAVYPGGNYYNNYNVRRNCVYRVTVKVNHDDDAQHVPSSNCIIVTPGKKAVFEPYYRVEVGGQDSDNTDRYVFSNYLNKSDPELAIDHVAIIWQTTDKVSADGDASRTVIGNNSSGTLVYYDDTKEKIFVKTRGEGNALIGAYNASGKLLWSWHIWSTNDEPENVGNAVVYTTYGWDSNGMHSDRDRVAGYSVMDRNLGALASDPGYGEDTWFQTWGMYYQWGRKDPFPPVKTSNYDIDWNVDNSPLTPDGKAPGRTHSYDQRFVTALYDNSNNRITGITEGTQSSNTFYTYSVWGASNTSGINTADQGIRFSIANPTVFMCGDDKPGWYNLGDNVNGEDCNDEYGDWLPEADNNLWGAHDPSSSLVTKSYKIPGSDYNTIYDNYGTQKSIFDPCPSGWRVPPDNLWLSFTVNGLNPNKLSPHYGGTPQIAADVNFVRDRNVPVLDNNQGPGVWMYMREWQRGPMLFFPTQGVRRPRGYITRVLMCGSYLSANAGQPINNPAFSGRNWINCLHMHYPRTATWSPIYFMVFEYANRIFRSKSTGGSVRCVRDTY